MIEAKFINKDKYSLKERERKMNLLNYDIGQAHILLSTCNRIEFYWGEGEVPYDITNHLYRVVSGLESSIIGEKAIQGQVKLAYKTACENYRLSGSLHQLFQRAICTGKRVRNETKISSGAVSHSQAVIDIIKKKGYNLKDKRITIIGINKLNEDIMKFLQRNGAYNILLSNRNIDKANDFAKQYKCSTAPLNSKRDFLKQTDILISTTSAPHTIIKANDLPKENQILAFDLAFPRDIEESVGELSNVELLNLENIEKFAISNIEMRKSEINKAEIIISEEIDKLYQWVRNHLKTKEDGKIKI